MDVDPKNVGARVRAARIQAGYKRRIELADVVPLPRFGQKLLGQIERGERPLYEHEAEALARVLPVSAEWFFEENGGLVASSISERLIALEIDIEHQNANLTQQTSLLARIDAAVKQQTSLLADLTAIVKELPELREIARTLEALRARDASGRRGRRALPAAERDPPGEEGGSRRAG